MNNSQINRPSESGGQGPTREGKRNAQQISGRQPMTEEKASELRQMQKREQLLRLQKMRAERNRRRRRADIICMAIVGILFAVVSVLNMFQFNRPTESEVEKRKLAEFPEFSFPSFASGEYTEGINSFFADTFLWRDGIVSLAKKMDTLRGYDMSLGDDGSFVVLDSGVVKEENDDSVSSILDSLGRDEEELPYDETDEDFDTTVPTIKLSKLQLTLTVGGGAVVTAEAFNVEGDFSWEISDESLVELSAEESQVKLVGKSSGEAKLICRIGDISAECNVRVESITSGGVDNGDLADFMTNGLFIYGDAVYTQGWYSEQYASDYAGTVAYYKQVFPNARVSTCVIPTSAIRIDNIEVKSQLPDQQAIFTRLSEIIGSKVNFVDTFGEMYAHRDEYIYFKSDHHWTQRGAYYAYKAFVESVGYEATPLDEFETVILSDSYSGSMYEYTKDERVKQFKDTVEAFITTKPLTMTVTDRSGAVTEYDYTVMQSSKTYTAFLCGDNPYTVINVPENPQDRNILVLKDSYGNAFVPFLAENYGNIMVVDTRYTTMNVKEMFADYDITDVLFVNNLEAANAPAWSKMYLRAVGVEVE